MKRPSLKFRKSISTSLPEAVQEGPLVQMDKGSKQGSVSIRSQSQASGASGEGILNASFTELVQLDAEGHPYIDINRLIFRPVKHKHFHHIDEEHRKDKLSRYIPDFSFIIANLLTLGISTYFCLIGISTLTWKSSVGMFSVPSCESIASLNATIPSPAKEANFYYLPCHEFLTDQHFKSDKGYHFDTPNSFPILRTKLADIHYFGLILICIQLINLINVIVGINAVLQGFKGFLIIHVAIDCFLVSLEFVVSVIIAFTSECDQRDIRAVRVLLKYFVRWYGNIIKPPEDESDKEKLINLELDALQIGLGCCGVDGWSDYLTNRYRKYAFPTDRFQLDESELVIPFSCCRPWWVRNIYCSHGIHQWTHPLASPELATRFHERIVQEGCVYKLEKLCLNMKIWAGKYGLYTTFMHMLLIAVETIGVIMLIRSIDKLIEDKKRSVRRREIFNENNSDESELEFSMDQTSGGAAWATIPPPTEDEILTIRHRTNFNCFMSRVKGSEVTSWMQEANEIVTKGHDDDEEEEEELTAEEKKRREKAMLHPTHRKSALQGLHALQKQRHKEEEKGKQKKNSGGKQEGKDSLKKMAAKKKPVARTESSPAQSEFGGSAAKAKNLPEASKGVTKRTPPPSSKHVVPKKETKPPPVKKKSLIHKHPQPKNPKMKAAKVINFAKLDDDEPPTDADEREEWPTSTEDEAEVRSDQGSVAPPPSEKIGFGPSPSYLITEVGGVVDTPEVEERDPSERSQRKRNS